MKKVFSGILVLCLLMALLPAVLVHAEASDPTNALQEVAYYDANAEEFLEHSTGILVTVEAQNCVITVLPSRESEEVYTIYTAEDDDVHIGRFIDSWEPFYLYEADSALGEAEGFTPVGVVTENEYVTLVLGWYDDGEEALHTTKAIAYEDEMIELKKSPGKIDYPVPVINSKDEICAVYYKESCYPLDTTETIFYGNTPSTEPEEPSEETSPTVEEEPEEEQDRDFDLAVELPELDRLYSDAIIQKTPDNTDTMIIIGSAAVALILAAVLVVVIIKKKQKAKTDLNVVEEGTQLTEETADTGVRLQFQNGRLVAINRSISVGRAPGNDVMIPETASNVSGRHCELVVQNGSVYLRDLGSRNGTFVNGYRVTAGQLIPLQHGMNVSLGGSNSSETFLVIFSGIPT